MHTSEILTHCANVWFRPKWCLVEQAGVFNRGLEL